MAGLVVVTTTSLPQPPSGALDSRSSGKVYAHDPFHYRAPIGRPGVGAIKSHEDVDLKLRKRDSHSPAGAGRDARQVHNNNLPCGPLVGLGQTDTFHLPSVHHVRLLWTFGGAVVQHHVFRLMRVNPHGRDYVVAAAFAQSYGIDYIRRPAAEALYYIEFRGLTQLTMTWFFAQPPVGMFYFPAPPPYAPCCVLLANNQQIPPESAPLPGSHG